ncbi:hypothetical protein BJ170DRAFT_379603 [Xylariales sp. AK1849]|nr:hypothetical protein BJ170DRAFT_379603 [Xylariales sp. AK1849]
MPGSVLTVAAANLVFQTASATKDPPHLTLSSRPPRPVPYLQLYLFRSPGHGDMDGSLHVMRCHMFYSGTRCVMAPTRESFSDLWVLDRVPRSGLHNR